MTKCTLNLPLVHFVSSLVKLSLVVVLLILITWHINLQHGQPTTNLHYLHQGGEEIVFSHVSIWLFVCPLSWCMKSFHASIMKRCSVGLWTAVMGRALSILGWSHWEWSNGSHFNFLLQCIAYGRCALCNIEAPSSKCRWKSVTAYHKF